MKYVLLFVAAYEGIVGLSELLWPVAKSPALAKVAALPSAASVVDSPIAAHFPSSAHFIEAGLDITIAALAGYIAVKGMK